MKIRENIPLAPLTTLKVGGTARYLVEVARVSDVAKAFTFARDRGLSVFVLGGGSNVLIADSGWGGLVIKMSIGGIATNEENADVVEVVAGAGVGWDDLVRFVVERGLWGLENLSAIPGTVGASPVQNIGAYGTELKDTFAWLEAYDPAQDQFVKLTPSDCAFGYRDSVFKQSGSESQYTITRVAFQLTRAPQPNLTYKDLATWFAGKGSPTLSEIREAVIAIRAQKFPDLSQVGCAGSFFKNPLLERELFEKLSAEYPNLPAYPQPDGQVKVSATWILDHICGLKGFTENGVALFENQPLVLINQEAETAEAVESFASKVAEQVARVTGITLEREVCLVGF